MDDDVLIKIGADIAEAVAALKTITESLTTIVETVSNVGEQTQENEATTKSFWETWVTGAENGTTASVAWGEQMSKAFDSLKEGVANAIKSLPTMVMHSAAVGDELQTMANQLNTTAGRLGELQYIAGQSGASMEGMARTTQTLGVTLRDVGSKGAQAIEQLGLNLKDLGSKDKTDAMFEIIQRIKDVVPAADQSATMLEIFGGRARNMTMLLKEDLGALRQSYRELGNSSEDLEKLAREGDRYSDAIANIRTVQDAWKNSIANALLPTVNDLLEKMPGLGGAVLTLGEGFASTASSILPLLGNIAMLKSSGLLSWVSSTAGSIPGMTSAVGGLTAALGPLAIAIAGVVAAFAAWKAANAESGWVRELSDAFEYAALRVQGYTAAEADAMIATQHATQRAQEAAAAKRAQAAATTELATAARGAVDPLQRIREANAAIKAELKGLTDEQKAAIRETIALKGDLNDLAKTLSLSTQTVQLYKDQVDAATEKQKELAKATAKTEAETKKFRDSVVNLNTLWAPYAQGLRDSSAELQEVYERLSFIPTLGGEALAARAQAADEELKRWLASGIGYMTEFRTVAHDSVQDEIDDIRRSKVEHVSWERSLQSMSQAWSQLAQIAGGSMGAMARNIGEITGLANTMVTTFQSGFENLKGGFATLTQSGGNAFMKIASSLPQLLTGITGIIGSITTAIQLGRRMWDVLTKSGGERAASEVGRDFGVQISEAMGDAFNRDAERLFHGDRFAANIYHLRDIIQSAGGVTEQNFGTMLGRLHDVFSMVEQGKFTTQQATQVLEENFTAFAEHATRTGQVQSAEFLQILQLQQRFGTESRAISDFIAANYDLVSHALQGVSEQAQTTADDTIAAQEEQAQETLDTQRQQLTQMLANRTAYNEQEIAQQRRLIAISESNLNHFAQMANNSMAGVSRAAAGAAASVNNNDWTSWADELAAAAAEAEAAINAVSFGSSPGGIKEIPIQLKKAIKSFAQFEDAGVGAADTVAAQVNSLAAMAPTASVTASAIGPVAEAGAAASTAGGGDEVSISFEIKALDAAGVQDIVEKQILPMLTGTLKRGRGLNDFKAAIGVA